MSRPFFNQETMPNTTECQAWLTQMQHGHIAASLLNELFPAGEKTPDHGVVYALPMFLPDTNIAVSWDVPTIGVVGGTGAVTAKWRASDRKFGDSSGEVQMGLACDRNDLVPGVTRFTSLSRLHRLLTQIVTDGETASWQLTHTFRPYISSIIERVSLKVAGEIGVAEKEENRNGVVDKGEIDQIADTYLLGNGTERGLFYRLLCRASSDLGDQSKVGDRITYITRNAQRDAEDEIRRTIKDPHTGRLVRRVFRSLGSQVSFDDLKQEFSRQFPGQSGLGFQRALDALTVGATPNQMASSIEAFMEASGTELAAAGADPAGDFE